MSYPSHVSFKPLVGKMNTHVATCTHPVNTYATQQPTSTQAYMRGHVSPTKGRKKSTYTKTNLKVCKGVSKKVKCKKSIYVKH